MLFIEKSECCGCNACVNICPKKCIAMQVDDEGFWYPQIDVTTCVNCNLCSKSCPILNTSKADKQRPPLAYAAINKNSQVRMNSSSGGIFTLLAEEVIKQNGIVFGATLSKDCCEVYHTSVDQIEDLQKLRGSKYLQSWMGDTYSEVKSQLENGREVLFSGTPCQIEGLKLFLDKKYVNLLCVDFICHGVPSPKVWKKYVRFREKSAGASAEQVFFRHKKNGWKTFTILFEFSNNTVYEQLFSKDLFMQAFLRDACLRPSCHACKFKNVNRESDITMADFWGVQKVTPNMDDDKGTSLVFVHSKKGIKYWDLIKGTTRAEETDIILSTKGNPSFTQSSKANKKRKKFFLHIDSMEFDQLVANYVKEKIEIKKVVLNWCRAVGLTDFIKKIVKRR